MHSSDSLRVRGYEFPSNSFNVDQRFQVQISPMRLPSKSEGHRCLKYQNVPYIRNFWHIGKPWERFQRWVRLIYFLTVPDDHTVSFSIVWKADLRGFPKSPEVDILRPVSAEVSARRKIIQVQTSPNIFNIQTCSQIAHCFLDIFWIFVDWRWPKIQLLTALTVCHI